MKSREYQGLGSGRKELGPSGSGCLVLGPEGAGCLFFEGS